MAQRAWDTDGAIQAIFAGTAADTGTEFFAMLVKNLALALDLAGAWVTEYDRDQRRLRALAFWYQDHYIKDYEYKIEGTPCEPVIDRQQLIHFPDEIVSLFPGDPDLAPLHAVAYMGMPFTDTDGQVIGHLAVLDTKPLPLEPRIEQVFRIFAARAAAELNRLKAEAKIRASEEHLSRLIDSAMDAIIELGPGKQITRINRAAERTFGLARDKASGLKLTELVSQRSAEKLHSLLRELDGESNGRQSLWIPGGLTCRTRDGAEFPAEATLSRFEHNGGGHFTLILRDINDQLEAERRIETLSTQTEYLREEIRELYNVSEIIGESEVIQRLLSDLVQVAPTDATVLIYGETGTGKELVARAIHAAGKRADRPLIKVNCATLPANLIESELFGHEKGAFTGATEKRRGRFALADGGTIFLDEIGELPLELQAKLLRVLQEGEFEPVGSSETVVVDVRVIAATNRDLKSEAAAGKFRQDLYYRLNVFPVLVPPLRQRGEDIMLLAEFFMQRISKRIGCPLPSLSQNCRRELLSYAWPGNVRELQNVLERAIITARDGELNLVGNLSEPATGTDGDARPVAVDGEVLTVQELRELERANLIRALQKTDWRVSGSNGAAKLLGAKPSTLSSRIRALEINRPD